MDGGAFLVPVEGASSLLVGDDVRHILGALKQLGVDFR